MRAFLDQMQVSNGLVQAFTLDTLVADDLPRPSPNPAGTYHIVNVDQWGRVVGGSAGGSVVTTFNTRSGDVTLTSADVTAALGGDPIPLAVGGTAADLSATGPGFVLQEGVGTALTVVTTTSLALTLGGLIVNGSVNFNDTLTVAVSISDSTATTSLDFSTPGTLAVLGGTLSANELHAGNGASGTFTSADLKTVTVVDGIITSIV